MISRQVVERLGGAAIAAGSVLMLVVLGWLVGTGDLRSVAYAMAAGALLAVVLRPELGLYVFVATYFLGERLFAAGTLPSAVRWLPDLVMVAYAVLVLARRTPWKQAAPAVRLQRPWVLLLTIVVVLSAVGNALSPAESLVGVRFYLKFPLLAILLSLLDLPTAVYRRLFLLVFGLTAIQVPVSLAQYLALGRTSDANSGTFGLNGGGSLLFVCMALLAVLLGEFVRGHRRWWTLPLGLSLVLAPLFAGARAVLIVAPIVVVVVLGRALTARDARNWVRGLVMVGLIAAVTAGALATSSIGRVLAPNLFGTFSEAIQYENVTGGGELGRLSSFTYSVNLARQTTKSLLIGYGPGTTGESVVAYGRLRTLAQISAFRSQLSSGVLELGPFGLALMVLTVLGLAWRTLRAPPPSDSVLSAVWFAAPAVALVYLALYFYMLVWFTEPSSFLLWCGAAAVACADRRSPDE